MHWEGLRSNGRLSDRISERPGDLFPCTATPVSLDWYLRQVPEVDEVCCEAKATHLIFFERCISNNRRGSHCHLDFVSNCVATV